MTFYFYVSHRSASNGYTAPHHQMPVNLTSLTFNKTHPGKLSKLVTGNHDHVFQPNYSIFVIETTATCQLLSRAITQL